MVRLHSWLKSPQMAAMLTSHSSIRWVFDCSQWGVTAQDWFKCLKSIQPEERERLSKFVFQNDAISSMVGRLLMRKLVVEVSHLAWKDVKIARSEKGKPYVPALPRVVFNVSHHGRLTVLAAEVFGGKEKRENVGNEEVELGGSREDKSERLKHRVDGELTQGMQNQSIADVEDTKYSGKQVHQPRMELVQPQLRESSHFSPGLHLGVDICAQDLPRSTPVAEFFRLMRRNFHPAEWDFIYVGRGEAGQLARFYRVWALKESFVKATGTGISVPLAEMCFLPIQEVGEGRSVYDTRVKLEGRETGAWLFEETRLEGGYCVAVALHRRESVEGRCRDREDNIEGGNVGTVGSDPKRNPVVREHCETFDSGSNNNSLAGVDEASEELNSDEKNLQSPSSLRPALSGDPSPLHENLEILPSDEEARLNAVCSYLGLARRNVGVDKAFVTVRYEDVKDLMQDVEEVDADEEMFYEAQDFVRKPVRSWDR